MKLKSIILAAGLLLGVTLQAQEFRLGIKANAGSSNLIGLAGSNPRTSIGGGLFASFKFAIIGVQADVLYQTFGAQSTGYDLPISYIQIPIVAKWHLLPFLNIQGGPYYGTFISENDDPDVFNSDNFNKSDVGAVAGVGAQFWRIHVDARYHMGFNQVFNSANTPGSSGKNSALMIGAGFSFIK